MMSVSRLTVCVSYWKNINLMLHQSIIENIKCVSQMEFKLNARWRIRFLLKILMLIYFTNTSVRLKVHIL